MRPSNDPMWMKEVLERDRLAETPTREIPAVKVSRPAQVDDYRPRLMLPRDRLGRPYLSIIDPHSYTLDLVQAAVQHFIQIHNAAPIIILLSASRYLEYGAPMHYYYPRSGEPIPYGYEVGSACDVVARGEIDGN